VSSPRLWTADYILRLCRARRNGAVLRNINLSLSLPAQHLSQLSIVAAIKHFRCIDSCKQQSTVQSLPRGGQVLDAAARSCDVSSIVQGSCRRCTRRERDFRREGPGRRSARTHVRARWMTEGRLPCRRMTGWQWRFWARRLLPLPSRLTRAPKLSICAAMLDWTIVGVERFDVDSRSRSRLM
jgi:hypothetical protein